MAPIWAPRVTHILELFCSPAIFQIYSRTLLALRYWQEDTGRTPLAEIHWQKDTVKKIASGSFWQVDSDTKILSGSYWQDNKGRKILARNCFQYITGQKILAGIYWQEDTGRKILAGRAAILAIFCRLRLRQTLDSFELQEIRVFQDTLTKSCQPDLWGLL